MFALGLGLPTGILWFTYRHEGDDNSGGFMLVSFFLFLVFPFSFWVVLFFLFVSGVHARSLACVPYGGHDCAAMRYDS